MADLSSLLGSAGIGGAIGKSVVRHSEHRGRRRRDGLLGLAATAGVRCPNRPFGWRTRSHSVAVN